MNWRQMKLLQKGLEEFVKFGCALAYAMFSSLIHKKPQRVVLCYHSVGKQNNKQFGKQMRYLARKCVIIKLWQIATFPSERNETMVAITFDDAFVSVMENAVPILKMYGLPAGIFVPTGNLGQPSRWETAHDYTDKNEFIMSEEQLTKLDKDGFEIFSHSVSHPVLTEIDNKRLQTELKRSKDTLEEVLGHEIVGISYPYGIYDAQVCRAAEQAGYKIGFTLEPCTVDCSPNNLEIGRFVVSATDSLLKFRLKVSGAYQVALYLRALKVSLKICLLRTSEKIKCFLRKSKFLLASTYLC